MLGNYRVEQNRLIYDSSIFETLRHFFNPAYHTEQIKKVADFFTQALNTVEGDAKNQVVDCADSFIQRYGSDRSAIKILTAFDREFFSARKTSVYVHPQNRGQFSKWTRASQPKEIFQQFPKFAKFMERSKLLSQIKVTRDTLRILDGEPAMLVEGKWTKWSRIEKRFKIEFSELYGTNFVTDSTGEVYTYLDNRLGLQKYHPYQTIGNIPISVLEEDEIDSVRKTADKFIRPNEVDLSQEKRSALNAERPFVLQIVTSYTDRGSTNFSQTMRNPRHAYARIVAGADLPEYNVKKGDVFEFGFGWKRDVLFPLEATQGHFCSPDPWEYVPCEKRYVTCAPISLEEAKAGFEFALRQQRKHVQLGREIGFQLTQQNCTVFVRKIAEHTSIAIPTEIELKPLLFRILPNFLMKLGSQIEGYMEKASTFSQGKIRAYTPDCVGSAAIRCIGIIGDIYARVRDPLTAFVLLPIRTLLGGWSGHGGESFDEGKEIRAPIRDLRNWFDLSSYRYNLPIILQEWQKEQPSTFVAENPVRLTIVSQE